MTKLPMTLRRRSIAALLPMGVAGIAAAALLTSSGAAAQAGSTTLHLHAAPFTQTRLPKPTDPQAPIRVGDRLFWVTALSRGGKHVGSASHVCTAADRRWMDCVATISLPRGQVELQTALDLRATDFDPIAVTGGTGCYRYARGQLRIVAFHNDGSAEWALQLTGTC